MELGRNMTFLFLFTPYGYKFAGKNEENKIFEAPNNTSVKSPHAEPWNFVKNGLSRVITGQNLWLGQSIRDWTANSGIAINGADHLLAEGNSVYPAGGASRWNGASVRCEAQIIFKKSLCADIHYIN